MRVKEIISEAAMSIALQAKYPVSAGARGLMGARFRYDKPMETGIKDIDKGAVDQLEHNLKYIPETHHDGVKSMVEHVSQTFRIEPRELHHAFVKKFNCSPHDYAINYKKSREGQPAKI